jgi:hypothetical protein
MSVRDLEPYGLDSEAKRDLLLAELNALSLHHQAGCPEYQRLVRTLWGGTVTADTLEGVPYLPVRLFKYHDLLSVPRDEIVKTMTSSGTSGQAVSRIFLDKHTASQQIKALAAIVGSLIGASRLPMLVVECRATVSSRSQFSARAAGILGFSMFGRDVCYALDDDMSLNPGRVKEFLKKHEQSDILLFGFTAIVWEHLVRDLEALNSTLPIERGRLIHGGGWKRLQSGAVSADAFKERLRAVTGIRSVHNYYGMVEQTGSIFMECEAGRLHVSRYSEIIIRDPYTLSPLATGQPGLIQLLSSIPRSYPGHSLLSEDLGELIDLDNCPCGRRGRTFKVHGRSAQAEIRGCSDTYTR